MIKGIGTQTMNVIDDADPRRGFALLKEAGFDCCDFSLNDYLKSKELYKKTPNQFFDAKTEELIEYFTPHKEAAKEAGIEINQMHMPYPVYVPGGSRELNSYLKDEMAVKSMEICRYLECPAIVIHGVKTRKILGSEEAEWQQTEEFLHSILPTAKEYGITVCIENLYTGLSGHVMEGPGTEPYLAAERIDRINARYGAEVLGFCFDTGHANLLGIDMRRFLNVLDKRIKVLHIHDNDGIFDLHQIPYTFTKTRDNEPSSDWEGFLAGLSDIDFDGVLSFETGPTLSSFPEGLRADALRLIASIGRYFKSRLEGVAE